MKATYEPIFTPFTFKSGATLKNRLLIAPMTTVSSFQNGMVTKDELTYYRERSQGVGAFITACAYVTFNGKGFPGCLGADDDKFIPSLSKLAKTIQNEGAKAILQIFHAGRMAPQDVIGGLQPVSASAVAAERANAVVPRELSADEVSAIIVDFGEATRRAIQAGFDGVEIHGANTYLIQQFFSPHSNRRDDQWGGSLDKRMTFPLGVVESVTNAVKKYANKPFIVGYRISPEEIENPGITLEDTFALAEKLAATSLDYLHVSLGNAKRGSLRNPEDKTPIIERLSALLGDRLPVIAVGSIHSPEDVLDILNSGIPLVAMGREFIVEPHWVKKVMEGKEAEIAYNMSLKDQEKLKIPDALWENLLSVPGWLPLAENDEHGGVRVEPWVKITK